MDLFIAGNLFSNIYMQYGKFLKDFKRNIFLKYLLLFQLMEGLDVSYVKNEVALLIFILSLCTVSEYHKNLLLWPELVFHGFHNIYLIYTKEYLTLKYIYKFF